MNKTLTSIIASVMLAGCTTSALETPALETPALEFPEFKQEDLVGTIPYIPVVHGRKYVWGTYKLYDLKRGDEFKWDWSMYFINCSHFENPPRFPFLMYNRIENELHQFDVHTGKYEGIIPGFIVPLNYAQPGCLYDIKINLKL